MKLKPSLIVLLLASLASTAVLAQDHDRGFVSLQVSETAFDADGIDNVKPLAAILRLGRVLGEHYGAEARFAVGIDKDEVELVGTSVDTRIELEKLTGVYLLYHTSPDFENSFYAVLGYTEAEIRSSANGLTVHDDDRGLSFGGGVNFRGFSFEAMQYLDENDLDATAVSVGYLVKF